MMTRTGTLIYFIEQQTNQGGGVQYESQNNKSRAKLSAMSED
jgi:hypothetical protein